MHLNNGPQERFDSLVQSLSSAVSREEWRDVMRRIPQIAERHGNHKAHLA